MATDTEHNILSPFTGIVTDFIGFPLLRVKSRKLKKELKKVDDMLTDELLEFLLEVMRVAFLWSSGYRKNIENFKGRYVFQTRNGSVQASATFLNGEMKKHSEAIENWDVRVTYKNSGALKRFLFSRDQDILRYLLVNDLETDGNINYIYKFAFMARDLFRRLGID